MFGIVSIFYFILSVLELNRSWSILNPNKTEIVSRKEEKHLGEGKKRVYVFPFVCHVSKEDDNFREQKTVMVSITVIRKSDVW